MYFCSVGCTFADRYPSSLVFTTAVVFVVLRNVVQMSANAGEPVSQQARPFYRMHHIWKMTYWGSRFWNIPFIGGTIKRQLLR